MDPQASMKIGELAMISLDTEQTLTMAEAAKHLPRRSGGKHPHPSTLFRWAKQGVRGVKLETIRVGVSLCTSKEAIQRFCNALSDGPLAPAQPLPVPASAQREMEALSKMGI